MKNVSKTLVNVALALAYTSSPCLFLELLPRTFPNPAVSCFFSLLAGLPQLMIVHFCLFPSSYSRPRITGTPRPPKIRSNYQIVPIMNTKMCTKHWGIEWKFFLKSLQLPKLFSYKGSNYRGSTI